ncbi:MAG TPA: enoyl-CoA hydratase-related protein [Dehalococcoidia bacterium]|nr:enoyl-CoA hydratase-related protein [Dehalococcoidia bacterium]
MSGRVVEVSREGPVARIVLCRPQVHNAFDEHLIAQLHEAFRRLATDEGVRVVVLAAEGPSFCAGADLDWMRRAASWGEEENRRDAAALAAMLRAVAECPRPVVARVHGNAFGGGVGLVAAADLAVAAAPAQFAFSEVRLGLAPATIAPHVVEKIGPGWALRLFLTGERIDAHQALRIGLLYRVVPPEELDTAVDEVVRLLLLGGPQAQAACKELVRRVARERGAQVDDYTARLIASLRSGDEGQEGVRSFLEKRRPRWAGEG